MVVSRKPYSENKYVKLGTYNIEIVKDFTYLGTILTNKSELRPEIEKKYELKIEHIMHFFVYLVAYQYSEQKKLKKKISKALLRPVATYGAESWTLNKNFAERLAACGRKLFRRMSGGIKVNENWRKRCNKLLMQVFEDLDMLSFVRINLKNWIGHVNRLVKYFTKKQMAELCTAL